MLQCVASKVEPGLTFLLGDPRFFFLSGPFVFAPLISVWKFMTVHTILPEIFQSGLTDMQPVQLSTKKLIHQCSSHILREYTNFGLLVLKSNRIFIILTCEPFVFTVLHKLNTPFHIGSVGFVSYSATESARMNIHSFLERWGLDCFVFPSPQWQTRDWQTSSHHRKNSPLSIFTALVAHIRVTAGPNLKIAASSQQEGRWILLAIYWQNEMKISTSTASSSAGYQHVSLIHGWNGRAHSLIILSPKSCVFSWSGKSVSSPAVHLRSMKS